eukprot:CAMPEP_0201492978 /NCGR_PEP_ID=MMETSP0151_2-20130828/35610_1 /ASSEMBLY_ACC=CAM_ASM_000257 /TAXON_ID=200890 /ORGANISM="Paramoeba atlantica, Strain 621/1 / CCAP 1560/9" /LENGTH=229 /DNA_ID=CAMNT_0047880087 /DNA_START=87 /DNA_END=776 /DNA_ORIENTATION=+
MSGWLWSGSDEDVKYPEIPTPSSADELKAIADQAVKEVVDCFNSDEGWNSLAFEEASDVHLFDKVEEGNPIVPVKSRGYVESTVDKIFALVAEDDVKKLQATLDPDLIKMEVLQTEGDVTVRYSAFTVGPMISSREFVYVQVCRDLPDGSKVLTTKSINRADKKQASGQVRGVISVAGMMVTPDKENPGRCMVHRTVQVDPKGMIPAWVINLNKTKSGQRILKIRELTK